MLQFLFHTMVVDDDAPFIHRFLCQPDSTEAFERIGTYLLTYINKYKNDPEKNIEEHLPIKAKFPQRDRFSIWVRYSSFYDEISKNHYQYIHEITNDDSNIGFSKLTTYYPAFKIVLDGEELDKLPRVPVKNPANTTERLKPESGSKKYKQSAVIGKRKKLCGSLEKVQRSTEKLALEEFQKKLKIIDEILSDDTVDQSGSDSKDGENNKVRKCRISTNGVELVKKIKEYTSNFDEFRQYLVFMAIQESIKQLQIYEVQKMKTVMNGKDESANPKCVVSGREREYMIATFQFEETFFGLLELENIGSSSTWVISSKNPLKAQIFDELLEYYVDANHSINEMKKKYDGSSSVKVKIKYHEGTTVLTDSDKIRWCAGALGKI